MKIFTRPLIACALGLSLAGGVQAFSFGDSNFSFGDDNWRPYYGGPYGAPGWGNAPPPGYFQPQLPSYDRQVMRMRRQAQMNDHNEAMDDLGRMLYGKQGFDRTKAVQMARSIEGAAGDVMLGNFHPGAVATSGSHTSPALWANQAAFKANADALKAAAGALADELSKSPSAEEGALMLKPARAIGSSEQPAPVAVSPAIWDKFNELNQVCSNCHRGFRGPSW